MNNDRLAAVEEIVKDLCAQIGIDAEIVCEMTKDDDGQSDVANISFEGERLGYMIGNSGRHLASLQYVLRMIINKKLATEAESAIYVNVDVAGYKKSRYEKIEKLALRKAEDARILGDAVELDPMSAAERRVVHVTLSKFPDIRTESHGEAPNRYVKIVPTSEEGLGITELKDDNDDEIEE